jgi:hypothetical protein
MSLELGALREALVEAGASQDKASKAAVEVAEWRVRASMSLAQIVPFIAGVILGAALLAVGVAIATLHG